MEDTKKKNSSLQPLGKNNVTSVFFMSVGTSLGECCCSTCYQLSAQIYDRSRADLMTCADLGPGHRSTVNSEMKGNLAVLSKKDSVSSGHVPLPSGLTQDK